MNVYLLDLHKYLICSRPIDKVVKRYILQYAIVLAYQAWSINVLKLFFFSPAF